LETEAGLSVRYEADFILLAQMSKRNSKPGGLAKRRF